MSGASSGSPTVVPIDTIVTDDRLQIRTEDQATFDARVGVLVESGRDNPGALPPLRVVLRGRELLLIDGHATLAALDELGSKTALVIVEAIDDSETARIERAFELNASHGFPLTMRDRKEHARWRRATFPTESISETARRCGLTRKTVGLLTKEDGRTTRPDTPPEPDPYGCVTRRLERLAQDEVFAEVRPAKLAAVLGYGQDANGRKEWVDFLTTTAHFFTAVAGEVKRLPSEADR